MNGKGSRQRTYGAKFLANYESINWKSNEHKNTPNLPQQVGPNRKASPATQNQPQADARPVR